MKRLLIILMCLFLAIPLVVISDELPLDTFNEVVVDVETSKDNFDLDLLSGEIAGGNLDLTNQIKGLNEQIYNLKNFIQGIHSGPEINFTDLNYLTRISKLRIYGDTVEIGDGVKSLNNPYALNSVENFDLISTDTDEQESTVTFNHTLRSLPDGTKDYIEVDNIAKTAKLYRNIGNVVLSGSQTYESYTYGNDFDTYTYHFYVRSVSFSRFCSAMSDKFVKSGKYSVSLIDENILSTNYSYDGTYGTLYGQLSKIMIDAYSGATINEKITNFFTNNPTIFQYQLITPIVTDFVYDEVKTYYPQMQIYTTAIVQPNLEVEFYDLPLDSTLDNDTIFVLKFCLYLFACILVSFMALRFILGMCRTGLEVLNWLPFKNVQLFKFKKRRRNDD